MSRGARVCLQLVVIFGVYGGTACQLLGGSLWLAGVGYGAAAVAAAMAISDE